MTLASINTAANCARLLATALAFAVLPALGAPAGEPPTPYPAPTSAPTSAQTPAQTPTQTPAQAATAATPPVKQSPAPDALLQLLADRGLVQAGLASLQPAVALAQHARELAAEAVIAAMAFLDLPYARGGTSAEHGFDCSGFTRHVFKHTLGLLLPRSAEQQAQSGDLQPIAADQLKPGDLVFFNTLRKAFSHVGIYVGDGRFVHSPRPGGAVRLDSMRQTYWATRFDGARRAALAAGG